MILSGIVHGFGCLNGFFKAKVMIFPLECHSQGIKTHTYFSNPHNEIVMLNHRPMRPRVVGLMRPRVIGEGNLLVLGWIKYLLRTKVQVSFTNHVQHLKAPRPRYKCQWIPLQSHAWFFEVSSMDIDSSIICLRPKSQYCSLYHHF